MARQKLILVASESMDSNKKPDRDENSLVRMSSIVRKNMNFNEDSVELCPAGASSENQAIRARMLKIFKAFSADIKMAKKMVDAGELTKAELKRVGFVTTKTLNAINGGGGRKKNKNIWVSNSIKNTVLGSDPEFLLFDRETENVIRAYNVLQTAGPLGSDGAMAEVRPTPSTSTEGIVSNIKKIFKNDKSVKYIEQYKWMSACYHRDNSRDYPVGGHIHIGTPAKIANLNKKTKEAFFIVLNKILDELLAIPLTKLDGAENGHRRRANCQVCPTGHHGYGFFGEMRMPHGRLEHRTLSGMWLVHPSVAKAVFGTTKAIVDEVFKLVSSKNFNSKYMCLYAKDNESGDDYRIIKHMFKPNFDGWKNVPLAKEVECIKSSSEMIKILNDSNPSYVSSAYLKKWLSRMKNFSTYKNNGKYVRGLYEILSISAKDLQSWDREIQRNWLGNKKFMVDL